MKTLLLWALSRSLHVVALAIDKRTRIPSVDSPRVYLTPWRVDRRPKQSWGSQYVLFVTDVDGDRLLREASLTRLVHCGRVVFGVEFSPDGPGTLYVLDARQQVWLATQEEASRG